jgi:hypothetical protein
VLSDLSPEARVLANYMSSISESTWRAGWMRDIEFELWALLVEGSGKGHGRLSLSGAEITRLRSLSDACGGWIYFDERTEETFASAQEWMVRFERWRSAQGIARMDA